MVAQAEVGAITLHLLLDLAKPGKGLLVVLPLLMLAGHLDSWGLVAVELLLLAEMLLLARHPLPLEERAFNPQLQVLPFITAAAAVVWALTVLLPLSEMVASAAEAMEMVRLVLPTPEEAVVPASALLVLAAPASSS
jgi:hypothetical protein